jgi:hypothetical protein
MKIEATITFKYRNEENAEVAFKSLEPDNIGYLKTFTEGKYFICNFSANSIGTLLSTADDLVFCETMVEKISEMIEHS